MHLLGLVDVSNLVYAFGVAYGLVSALFIVVNESTVGMLDDFAKKPGALLRIVGWQSKALILFGCSIALWFAGLLWQPVSFLASDFLQAVAFFGMALYMATVIFVRHRVEARVSGIEAGALALLVIFFTYNSGQAKADYDLYASTDNRYDLHIKQVGMVDARILRSSSGGLIVAVHGKVRFVPKDQLISLVSRNPVKWP